METSGYEELYRLSRYLRSSSDDDEWQPAECGIPVDDDDSVVESPTDQGTSAHYEHNHEEDFHEDIEDDDEDRVGSSENVVADICRTTTDEEDEGDIDEISGPHVENFIDKKICVTWWFLGRRFSPLGIIYRLNGNSKSEWIPVDGIPTL
ncbi:hypothetical protein CCACVL1_17373 [Corchorus capsularis]|uniref:Uncharacterized protein n=1 Tax=Corchorus capsularis TaxID=210143 RepID=A0A1R3HS63_COCAP|nr:hypothetical protein CCACVL1_17373 [Corchorus capsularis]